MVARIVALAAAEPLTSAVNEASDDNVGALDIEFVLDGLCVGDAVEEAVLVDVGDGVGEDVDVPDIVAEAVADAVGDTEKEAVLESDPVREGLAPRVIDDVGVMEAEAAAL